MEFPASFDFKRAVFYSYNYSTPFIFVNHKVGVANNNFPAVILSPRIAGEESQRDPSLRSG